MPRKSIFRQPGAKHFQLVHRSQRDPLIHDEDASKHVLKPFERVNAKKGKSRAELEDILSPSDIQLNRDNIGEASLYGIYYDDTEYDYMQHLRKVGVKEDGVASVLIEAPTTSRAKHAAARPAKDKTGNSKPTSISLKDLPPDVLPSTSELPRDYESQQPIPSSISGFQPDMDPHLRQVLEALEDDGFVDDDLEDDFFGELIKDGERGSDDEIQFEFQEYGLDETEKQSDGELGWEARFARFKKEQRLHGDQNNDSDYGSEGGDTLGRLPEMSVLGGKGRRRRKGTSDASGYTMSSSSMYRTEALQTLDERFDQMILKEYNENEYQGNENDDATSDSDSTSSAPELITSRTDFNSMMDDFLTNYEVLGRKVQPKLEGSNGTEKLETLRRALGHGDRVRVNSESFTDEDDEEILAAFGGRDDDKKDKWDCETILTTYSNLENHPRLIRARDSKPVPKIHLDRRGMPTVQEERNSSRPMPSMNETSSDTDEEVKVSHSRTTVSRPRHEPKEEKKERKAAVKAERQARRVDKKVMKEQFANELKAQKRAIGSKETAKMRKI